MLDMQNMTSPQAISGVLAGNSCVRLNMDEYFFLRRYGVTVQSRIDTLSSGSHITEPHNIYA